MTIDSHRLTTQLNELFRAGQTEMTIQTPFVKAPIFRVLLLGDGESRAGTVELRLPYPAYRDALAQHTAALKREIPDYGALQALLVQAGVVRYPNFKDLLRHLHALGKRDFYKGDRPVFLGLDTNLLRDRFYSANHDALRNLPENKIGFSISPNVKDELTFDKRKYKERDLREMARMTIDRHFAEAVMGFFNQSCLTDRLRRIGFVELAKAKRLHWIELLPELDAKEVEESPDLNIIKTYKLAAQERNLDVLLLSRDDSFIGHAQGIPGVEAFQIANPAVRAKKRYPANWRSLSQLLYLNAVVFGAVRVQAGPFSFMLQGIWKGKKTDDWNKERLRIGSQPENDSATLNCRKMWRILEKANWSPETM